MRPVERLNETAGSILGFLSFGPMTGWSLNELAQESVGNFWNITRSQIYRELGALEALGLVRGEDVGERSKRRFQLTEAGDAAFGRWLRSEPGPGTTRNPFLVRLFFAGTLTREEREALIDEARTVHERNLDRYRAVLAEAEALSPFAAATARYGIAVERAVLDWFAREGRALTSA